MRTSYRLDGEDIERLLLVQEASLHVSSSSSFFLWTQGALQLILPHEILICALARGIDRAPELRWFSSSRYFQQAHYEESCHSADALVPMLMKQWFDSGRPQLLVGSEVEPAMASRLLRLELRNVVAHGVRGAEPFHGGYFCFARSTAEKSPRIAHILDLLMPCIYSTYCRVQAEEAQPLAGARGQQLITGRESEILDLIKEGKTTSDIALCLALSPFTVRNHVKNIFKKLGARSRSHAVAQAISLGLLRQASRS